MTFLVQVPGSDEAALPAVALPRTVPSPAANPKPPDSVSIGLPVAVPARRPAQPAEPRLPSPEPNPFDEMELDLPAALGPIPSKPGAGSAQQKPPQNATRQELDFGEIDLPTPSPGLPAAPRRSAGTGARGDPDLPAILSAGLPATSGAALPVRSTGGLPSPKASASKIEAPTPAVRKPSSASLSFGQIDLPLLTPEAPVVSASLPTPAQSEAAKESPLGSDRAERDKPTAPGVSRNSGGGISFGEVSLGDEEHAVGVEGSRSREGALTGNEVPPLVSSEPRAPAKRAFAPESVPDLVAPLGAPSPQPPIAVAEDDMEFGGLPQAPETGTASVPALAPTERRSREPAVRRASVPVPRAPPTKLRIVAGAIAILIIAGASLEVLTPYGAFGRHAIVDALNADKFAALQTAAIADARGFLAHDTFSDAKKAIAVIDAAHARAPRVPGLLAYGAYVGYITELRYGRGPVIDAHAKQLLAQVPADKVPPYAELARAADAAVESQLPRAKQLVESLAQRDPQDVDVAALAGEVELLIKEPRKALENFTRAASLDAGAARSSFGIARAKAALGDQDAAVSLARKILEGSPNHAGARLLVARSLWNTSHDEVATTAILEQITLPGPTREGASPMELVEALTATARVHMTRSRMTQAESALGEALNIEPKSGPALAGMGEVLYREGRFTDALARFEAGIQADPEGTAAKIGAAKTKIALERLQEAKEQLKRLRDARPGDLDAAYWLGRAEEALGDKTAAMRAYGEAIAVGAGKPEVVDAYVALAQLLAKEGHLAESEAKLAEAKNLLPASSSLQRAFADVDFAAGRYEAAANAYQAALQSDPEDLASRFKLGVTLRRMNKFDEARAEYDAVAAQDKEYPGLALERGLLYEASNRTREALEYYQQALAKAPDDPDMMLRVGSAEVIADQASQAEEILRKVIAKRPNSAEVNHYLGRSLLLKGTNLAEALRYLKRAVEIDPNRAEYHLYVGWAANESGQPGVAHEALAKALELDKGLADAYWQLGVMQRKQGAVIDAVRNLQKAIELRPSRFEAYATLAECFEDENRPADAIAAWRKAIAADANRSEWHYRLGKLLGRRGESELRQAVVLCETTESRPGWLAQAYFELAELERVGGRRPDAVAHYRKFMALAKVDSPYRADAEKALASLGAPYEPPP